MSQEVTKGKYGQRDFPDYLDIVANVLYAVTGVLFIGGLWFDWQDPGNAIITPFALANEPEANSGLFIAAVLVLAVGYIVSKGADKIREYRLEEVDETQEWTVDVGE